MPSLYIDIHVQDFEGLTQEEMASRFEQVSDLYGLWGGIPLDGWGIIGHIVVHCTVLVLLHHSSNSQSHTT